MALRVWDQKQRRIGLKRGQAGRQWAESNYRALSQAGSEGTESTAAGRQDGVLGEWF